MSLADVGDRKMMIGDPMFTAQKPLRPSGAHKAFSPEQMRVFENGTFLFAAFEHGREMVVDLKGSDPKKLTAILKRLLPK